ADVEAPTASCAGAHPAPNQPQAFAERRQRLVLVGCPVRTKQALERGDEPGPPVLGSRGVIDLAVFLSDERQDRVEVARGDSRIGAGLQRRQGVRAYAATGDGRSRRPHPRGLLAGIHADVRSRTADIADLVRIATGRLSLGVPLAP